MGECHVRDGHPQDWAQRVALCQATQLEGILLGRDAGGRCYIPGVPGDRLACPVNKTLIRTQSAKRHVESVVGDDAIGTRRI